MALGIASLIRQSVSLVLMNLMIASFDVISPHLYLQKLTFLHHLQLCLIDIPQINHDPVPITWQPKVNDDLGHALTFPVVLY